MSGGTRATREGPFAEWRLAVDGVGARILSVSSLGFYVETPSDTIAAAAQARALVSLTVEVGTQRRIDTEVSVVDLGWSADAVPFFELSPNLSSQQAVRRLFIDEVLPSALAHRYTPHHPASPAPFRWCFAGVVGDVARIDSERHGFDAVDPTGELGRFVRKYDTPACVDILLGSEHLTCVPSFLFARAGVVGCSARTSEVGRPVNFAALTRLIVEHQDIGSNVARWRDAIRHAFREMD